MTHYIVESGDLDKVCVSCMYCGFNYIQISRNLFWLLKLHEFCCEREPTVTVGDRKWDACLVSCNGGSPLPETRKGVLGRDVLGKESE